MELKFNIKAQVLIRDLKTTGKVVSIWIVERGIQYEVRYSTDTEYKTVYFYEEELDNV